MRATINKYSTPEWKAHRLARFKERGKRCERCGTRGTWFNNIGIHHRDGNFYNWSDENEIILCWKDHKTAQRDPKFIEDIKHG